MVNGRFRLRVLFLLAGLALAGGWTQVEGQTSGRITGVVRDPSGAVVPGAEVSVTREATGELRRVLTDGAGTYEVPLLPPGLYQVRIAAAAFQTRIFPGVVVHVTETTTLDADLALRQSAEEITVDSVPPLVQTDGSQLGRVVDSRGVAQLPLATRNFTQLLSLSPGTATHLPDSTAVGRNSQAISVNGGRVTQNNIQINGIDANTMGTNGPILVAVPAPESVQEFKVQTALYDAAFGRAGGANIQLLTKSGGNDWHGSAYEYFRNTALNANNPFLKAAGIARPVLRRNVFGATFGGRLRPGKAFFFVSYQGTRERNAASLINSISSDILIAPGLSDDRSAATLSATFGVASIHPAALALLNARLPNGQFAIPTPRANGRFSASTPSTFREDQFNTNLDFRLGARNSLAVKFFFADTSQFLALPSFRGAGPNVPGFGTDQTFNNRVLSIQDMHGFSATLFNEARLGYAFNSNNTVPQEPVNDSDLGIARANAAQFPGLGLIRIAQGSGGVIIGTPTNISPTDVAVTTLADTLSLQRGRHSFRFGAEVRYNEVDFTAQQFTRGQIDFQSFANFLSGTTQVTTFGSGLSDRSQRAWDYNFFAQDDWKLGPRLTLNLGLRYELDLPIYDTRGRLTTFDPTLYVPRPLILNGAPAGPPIGGFVQAGNVIAALDLPEVPNVSKYVLHSTDPNNLALRLGLAWSALGSGRLVVRAGYGMYFSRVTFQYASVTNTLPPNFVLGVRNNAPLDDPFFAVPPPEQFPTFVPGVALAGQAFDRGLRTPYVHQYGLSVQSELIPDLLLEIAYVGTQGRKFFRQVAINQAPLASPANPIFNVVTGATITTTTPGNAPLRAPFQGVSITGFTLNQSTAESRYDSLQLSLTKRLSRGVQFLAAYTFARSIDDASGAGGGAGIAGVVNTGAVGDTSVILGDHGSPRANRGPSDFDRTHRLVWSYLWNLPTPGFAGRSAAGRRALGDWSVSGIVTAMSGLPVDIVDTGAGSLYGLAGGNNPLARPNPAPGQSCASALRNAPAGSYFNPFAFARPVVASGQAIPSSGGSATAAASGTDIGTVGRNCLRGPRQVNWDFAVAKLLGLGESRNVEFRAEFFNLFNQVNRANPISNFNAAQATGSINATTGQIISPGNFGRIISTSSNPRIIQLALKLQF